MAEKSVVPIFAFQIATTLRLLAYLFFAALLTVLYYDVGNKATRVMNNTAMFLLLLTVILFQSMMPTVLICKL